MALAFSALNSKLLTGNEQTELVFPRGFFWGVATAAYQIEGGVQADGRGPTVWDRFSHTPGVVKDGNNGDIACDSYHRYKDDIALMRELNLNSYRYSIAWSVFNQQAVDLRIRKGLITINA